MKALFSTFGRKSAAHLPTGSPSTKEGSTSSAAYPEHPRTPLRHTLADGHVPPKPRHVIGTSGWGGDIGAAPAPVSSPWREDSGDRPKGGSANEPANGGGDWSSRFAGTIRGSTRRKKERGKLSRDEELLPAHEIAAEAGSGDSLRRPPSSYRDPASSLGHKNGLVTTLYDDVWVRSRSRDQIEVAPAAQSSKHDPPSRSPSFRSKVSLGLNQLDTSRRSKRHPPSALLSHTRPLSSYVSLSVPENHLDRGRNNLSVQKRSEERLLTQRESDGWVFDRDGSTQAPLLPAASMPVRAAGPPVTSEDLAAKLNELAIANTDGLLNEDEYRALRSGLFEKMMQMDGQAMEVPQEPNVAGLGAVAAISNSGHLASNSFIEQDRLGSRNFSHHHHLGDGGASYPASPKASSTQNSTFGSVSSFFRRGSIPVQKQTSGDSLMSSQGLPSPLDDRQTIYNSAPSLLSGGDGRLTRPGSAYSHWSNPAKSSRASTLSRFRTGSQSKRLQAEAMTVDMERSFSAARSARSLRAQSIYDTSAAPASTRSGPGKIGLLGSSAALNVGTPGLGPTPPKGAGSTHGAEDGLGADMLGVDYADKSSAEIRAEIAVVQAEGSRLLDTFDSLEQMVIGKYRLDYPTLKRVVDEVKGIGPGSEAGASVSGSTMASSHAHTQSPSRIPPSSYRPPRAMSLSRRSSASNPSVDVGGSHPTAARQPFGGVQTTTGNGTSATHLSTSIEDPGTEDREVEMLRTELRECLEKRNSVQVRYEERTAFLRSKLRSATIREGLLR